MSAWFETWFDSPFYPLLYKDRDACEAENFIRKLVAFLKPAPDAKFLDLGCGRGRHSVFLHSLGYDVCGMDLSSQSIAEAKQFEKSGLQFLVGDMRLPLPGKYDFILNLFTSFGYLEKDEDHLAVLKNVYTALEPKGVFVLDFFNTTPVRCHLPEEKIETRGEISFHISKSLQGKYVVKNIGVADGKDNPRFQERVRFFQPDELSSLCESAGFSVFAKWGNYSGDAFDESSSSRLVLFCRKEKPE